MTDGLRVYVAGRQDGKTLQTIAWLSLGHRIDIYPGWSRILLTVNEREADRLRKEYGLDDQQVYPFRDWMSRYKRGFARGLEVAIDNADMILQDLVGDQRLAFVTLTGDVGK
jgi:hypothetical protein